MEPITFAIRLEGQAVQLDGDRYWAETHQRAAELVAVGAGAAACRRRLELWDDGSLVQTGELDFGGGDAVTFRARGVLGEALDGDRRHGTAVLEVTGGRGRLAGARGYVTSNFLLAGDGGLTDHQLGVLFVEREEERS